MTNQHNHEYLTSSTSRTARRVAIRNDFERTAFFVVVLILFTLLVQVAFSLLVLQEGLSGYLARWAAAAHEVSQAPFLGLLAPLGLAILFVGVHLWRHPLPARVKLPEYPPVPDLRDTDDIYLGSAWTRDGKQPGETATPQDEMFSVEECHVILKEKGLFGNLHVKGAVGSGKTTCVIEPFIDQVINKYPAPVPPTAFHLDVAGRLSDRYKEDAIAAVVPLVSEEFRDEAGRVARSLLPRPPYTGMTPEEAEAEYNRLLRRHVERKWGLFIVDPKGDLTDMVLRSALMARRSNDVIVLRPDGQYTYNPLTISSNALVQAEMLIAGMEAISRQNVPQYWGAKMSEWLANALEILRAADPGAVNFQRVLAFARDQTVRNVTVRRVQARAEQLRAAEAEARARGGRYTGPRVSQAAIDFFVAWDRPDKDRNLKQDIVSGIEGQLRYFVDSEMAPFLCPELPPTFSGFDQMIDDGKIIVLRMPQSQYGQVGAALGILLLADAQQAAKQRINRPGANQERAVAFVIDELSAYLNVLTKDFVATNRQSRVCVLAAHQSQSQLIIAGDRGFESAFTDNLRTKISFSTSNAESALRESLLFGARRVVEETKTEVQTFRSVERRGWERDPWVPDGSEMQGGTVRFDERDCPWFHAQDFMDLETGELVVSEYDGQRNRHPRKVVAPPYHELERVRLAQFLRTADPAEPPHPVFFINGKTTENSVLVRLIALANFAIIEPLFGAGARLAGVKVVTDVGTAVVDLDALGTDALRESLQAAIDPEHRRFPVMVTDPECYAEEVMRTGMCGDRPILFSAIAQDRPDDSEDPASFRDLLVEHVSFIPPYQSDDGWSYHENLVGHLLEVTRTSRAMIQLYRVLAECFGADAEESAAVEEARHPGVPVPPATVADRDRSIDSVGRELGVPLPEPEFGFGSLE